jgi:iron only hydrogenase large subunit-like protein
VSLRNGNYYQVEKDGSEQILKEAAITLNDCLACSGCITSAETVLIAMQHEQELLSILKERNGKVIVVSVSSQSRASLGAKWGMTKQEVWNALCFYFKSVLGVDDVFDIDFARDLSLMSTAKEFLNRFSTNQAMLSSACPGWICYAEKTHPVIIPLLDTSKSPQQVMGSLVKDYYTKKRGISPNQIYHVSVMPCYDKKLEASRKDFYNDVYSTRDVDLVLSTLEVEKLVAGSNLNPRQLPVNQLYHSM